MTKETAGNARELAQRRCEALIDWYETQKRRQRILDIVSRLVIR